MTITRDQLVAAIALERRLSEILKEEARAGVHSGIRAAQQGFDATAARHAALQRMLDAMDQDYAGSRNAATNTAAGGENSTSDAASDAAAPAAVGQRD